MRLVGTRCLQKFFVASTQLLKEDGHTLSDSVLCADWRRRLLCSLSDCGLCVDWRRLLRSLHGPHTPSLVLKDAAD